MNGTTLYNPDSMIFYFAFSVFFCLVFVLNALGRLTEGIVIDLLENHEIN